jgi:diacylglycerol kinase family enzyme
MFRMAPAADPADGKLTFVHAYAASRLKMLRLLPQTISGDYTVDPAVHQYHTTRLEIEVDPGTPLQVDGEIRGTDLSRVSYSILPAHLDLIHPTS